MVARSAGILLYRSLGPDLHVLLAHPGGPYWARKDAGAWSIPKGEHDAGEDPWAAALREFEEETGVRLAADGLRLDLGEIRQAGGKRVTAFALAGDLDPAGVRSNRFSLEWPPGSGRFAEFPEVDRAEWFSIPVAREKIIVGQRPFIERLVDLLKSSG
jgi:predicted NUDIX family NTP pyrophosphohydrolase